MGVIFPTATKNEEWHGETPTPSENDMVITSSRTTGVVPLAVSFNLVDDSTWEDDDEDVMMVSEFIWDFGDTGDDYNVGKGYCPSHVYREAGSYTATVRMYYMGVYLQEETVNITATAFSGTTYYISADGSDSADGLTESTAFATPDYAFTNYFAQDVQFLLRQGDTFSQDSGISFGSNGGDVLPGPVIFSSYEDSSNPSDDKPIIYDTRDDTSNRSIFALLNADDFRLINIKLQGAGDPEATRDTDSVYPSGFVMSELTPSANCLMLDCDVQGCGSISIHIEGDNNVVQDCTVRDGGSYGVYSAQATNSAYIGNSLKEFANDSPEYTIRLSSHIVENYLAYNDFWGDFTKCTLTVRGDDSSYNYVWKNGFDRFAGFNQTNDEEDETLHHNTFDSNINVARDYDGNTSGAYNTHGFFISSNNSMARNNIVYGFQHGFYFNSHTLAGGVNTAWLYNNTVIATDENSDFIRMQADSADLDFKNNVFYNEATTSSYSDRYINYGSINDDTFDELDSDYNITIGDAWGGSSSQIYVGIGSYDDDPTFTEWQALGKDTHTLYSDPLVDTTIDTDDVDGSIVSGFASLGASSPAIDSGDSDIYCLYDFNGDQRDSKDMGAICTEVV